MTIYEQIKEVMKGKKGEIVSATFIKNELKNKYGANVSSVLPSDFCYNRANDGIDFRKGKWLFKYIGRNCYEYLGENDLYTGEIIQKPYRSKSEKVVGRWVNGKLRDMTI